MNRLVFIIGMRRSGTSFLRELVMSHPEVGDILYEPHHFMYAMKVSEMTRYYSDKYVTDATEEMRELGRGEKWGGAKIALNPGIEAMTWKKIHSFFPDAKYVFITRDPTRTYDSWVRTETSIRGVCDYDIYLSWWEHVIGSFHNTGGACHIEYERLVEDADKEMVKVWDLLRVDHVEGLDKR